MSTAIAVSWATCETRCPASPHCPSCSVEYLEAVCWFRALEQRQRLFHCTGSNIAHRLPAGQRTEFILSSREAQIQSLEYASGGQKMISLFLVLFEASVVPTCRAVAGCKQKQNGITHFGIWVFMKQRMTKMGTQMEERPEHTVQWLRWWQKHVSVGCWACFYAFLPFSLATR